MFEIIDYIKELFPNSWLSNLAEDEDSAGVDIVHPKNADQYLTVDIFPQQLGIGVLQKSERDIELDLSGFDYTFSKDKIEDAKDFLSYFFKTGKIKNSI